MTEIEELRAFRDEVVNALYKFVDMDHGYSACPDGSGKKVPFEVYQLLEPLLFKAVGKRDYPQRLA